MVQSRYQRGQFLIQSNLIFYPFPENFISAQFDYSCSESGTVVRLLCHSWEVIFKAIINSHCGRMPYNLDKMAQLLRWSVLKAMAAKMPNPKRILVTIDDFQRATHLIDYVGELAGGHDDFKIHLFHATGPLPPQLLESSGAEGSAAEQHIEQKQVRQQENWVDRTRDKITPQLANQKSRLTAANVPASEIETHLILLNQRQDLIAEIVKAARDNDCGTIVVGHNSYPWIREQFHTHTSDQLVSESPDMAVCVVTQ
jgi:Universal stress protein family